MNEEAMRRVASAMGVTQEELNEAAALQVMVTTSLDLARLVHFVKQNRVFTEEVQNRFGQAVKNYLVELRLILGAQADIESLREEY